MGVEALMLDDQGSQVAICTLNFIKKFECDLVFPLVKVRNNILRFGLGDIPMEN